jgi:Protein of unknown function (DUF2855)
MTGDRWTIAIDRDDIRGAQLHRLDLPALAEGQVEVAITSYAMTANNITYAALGKPIGLFGNHQGYWDFFSAPGAPGTLPVWGFATVTASQADGIAVGEDFYGYFPMASHAVLTVGKAGPNGFTDVTPHRTTLPPIYNQYQRVSALADYRAADRDLWPIFRPLFLTGWMIADQLEEESDYGATQILVASASSKTAICLGHAYARRSGPRAQTIGLTSAANVAELAQRGIYDAVMAYDDIAMLDPAVTSVLVDIAGSDAVTSAVHQHFGAALKASIIVGKSHWDASADQSPLPGAPRQGFFAPARSQKRIADWGPAGFGTRLADAWLGFMAVAPSLCTPDHRRGGDAALAAYRDMLAGTADPAKGLLVTP